MLTGVTDGVKKAEKYTVNDFLRHLHAQICEENPDTGINISFFRRHDRNTFWKEQHIFMPEAPELCF